MPRLVACPACSVHFKVGEATCPHCGEPVRLDSGGVGRAAGAVLLGLTVASCRGEPEYGVPATDSVTTAGTEGDTDGTGGTGGTDDGATSTTKGTSATTGSTESTGTGTDAGTDGSTSLEPEYGVPTTDGSTSLEPEYGVPTTDA